MALATLGVGVIVGAICLAKQEWREKLFGVFTKKTEGGNTNLASGASGAASSGAGGSSAPPLVTRCFEIKNALPDFPPEVIKIIKDVLPEKLDPSQLKQISDEHIPICSLDNDQRVKVALYVLEALKNPESTIGKHYQANGVDDTLKNSLEFLKDVTHSYLYNHPCSASAKMPKLVCYYARSFVDGKYFNLHGFVQDETAKTVLEGFKTYMKNPTPENYEHFTTLFETLSEQVDTLQQAIEAGETPTTIIPDLNTSVLNSSSVSPSPPPLNRFNPPPLGAGLIIEQNPRVFLNFGQVSKQTCEMLRDIPPNNFTIKNLEDILKSKKNIDNIVKLKDDQGLDVALQVLKAFKNLGSKFVTEYKNIQPTDKKSQKLCDEIFIEVLYLLNELSTKYNGDENNAFKSYSNALNNLICETSHILDGSAFSELDLTDLTPQDKSLLSEFAKDQKQGLPDLFASLYEKTLAIKQVVKAKTKPTTSTPPPSSPSVVTILPLPSTPPVSPKVVAPPPITTKAAPPYTKIDRGDQMSGWLLEPVFGYEDILSLGETWALENILKKPAKNMTREDISTFMLHADKILMLPLNKKEESQPPFFTAKILEALSDENSELTKYYVNNRDRDYLADSLKFMSRSLNSYQHAKDKDAGEDYEEYVNFMQACGTVVDRLNETYTYPIPNFYPKAVHEFEGYVIDPTHPYSSAKFTAFFQYLSQQLEALKDAVEKDKLTFTP